MNVNSPLVLKYGFLLLQFCFSFFFLCLCSVRKKKNAYRLRLIATCFIHHHQSSRIFLHYTSLVFFSLLRSRSEFYILQLHLSSPLVIFKTLFPFPSRGILKYIPSLLHSVHLHVKMNASSIVSRGNMFLKNRHKEKDLEKSLLPSSRFTKGANGLKNCFGLCQPPRCHLRLPRAINPELRGSSIHGGPPSLAATELNVSKAQHLTPLNTQRQPDWDFRVVYPSKMIKMIKIVTKPWHKIVSTNTGLYSSGMTLSSSAPTMKKLPVSIKSIRVSGSSPTRHFKRGLMLAAMFVGWISSSDETVILYYFCGYKDPKTQPTRKVSPRMSGFILGSGTVIKWKSG